MLGSFFRHTNLLSSSRWILHNRALHLSHGLLSNRSYYEVLGVSRSATNREIKNAYFSLAKKYHPDANPGSPDAAKKFQDVAEAYGVLSDQGKRQNYDFFGSDTSNNSHWHEHQHGGPFGDFKRSSQSPRGDQRYNFYYKGHISPEEAEKMFKNIMSEFEKSMGSMQGINIRGQSNSSRKNPIKNALITMALNFLVKKFIERLFGGGKKKIGRK